jgi:hypothetical protein
VCEVTSEAVVRAASEVRINVRFMRGLLKGMGGESVARVWG